MISPLNMREKEKPCWLLLLKLQVGTAEADSVDELRELRRLQGTGNTLSVAVLEVVDVLEEQGPDELAHGFSLGRVRYKA
jgi:hypothetical protein